MWEYTDKLKEHFFNPRNVGEIEDADGVGEVGSLACGDALRLTFKLDKKGKIENAKFKTFGCASAIATSSVLTELIKGKTLEQAAKITNRDIADYLGGLPEQKMHCSVMGREALEAAIENYKSGRTKKRALEGNVVCTCFGVTDKEIERVIRENNLTTVDHVTHYCKAGGGCGGCKGQIEKIIAEVQGDRIKQAAASTQRRPAKLTNIQKIQLVQQTINEQIRPPPPGRRREHRAYRRRRRQGHRRLPRNLRTMQACRVHDERRRRGETARIRLRGPLRGRAEGPRGSPCRAKGIEHEDNLFR